MTHQPPRGEQVGSLADEAARLLAAFQDRARGEGGDGDRAGTAASGLADGLRDLEEHLATGAEECRCCPLCRAVSAVRGISPEVRAHLASAAGSLLQAAAAALATPVPDHARRSSAEVPVEHIDLDDDGGGEHA